MKCKKRKEKIENFGKQLTNYKQLKIKFKSELEEEELNLKALINNKEQRINAFNYTYIMS